MSCKVGRVIADSETTATATATMTKVTEVELAAFSSREGRTFTFVQGKETVLMTAAEMAAAQALFDRLVDDGVAEGTITEDNWARVYESLWRRTHHGAFYAQQINPTSESSE